MFALRVRFNRSVVEEDGEVVYSVGHCIGVAIGFAGGIGQFENDICPRQLPHHVGNGCVVVHMVVWKNFRMAWRGVRKLLPHSSCAAQSRLERMMRAR